MLQYQTLITVLAYLKQIKLVEAYPNNFTQIIGTLTDKIIQLIPQCNTETIGECIDSLTILARTNKQCAQEMGPKVLPTTLQLFSSFH